MLLLSFLQLVYPSTLAEVYCRVRGKGFDGIKGNWVTSDNANKYAYNLIKNNNKVIATASSGNVVIDCIKDTQITIRRDA